MPRAVRAGHELVRCGFRNHTLVTVVGYEDEPDGLWQRREGRRSGYVIPVLLFARRLGRCVGNTRIWTGRFDGGGTAG